MGLFGYINGYFGKVVIKNLTIESGSIIGADQLGAIVGRTDNNGYIINCVNKISVKGRGETGGIVGHGTNGTVCIACENYGKISATGEFASGVMGHCEQGGDFIACLNHANIAAERYDIGGIAGCHNDSGEFTACLSEGMISGADDQGGIVGVLMGTATNNACHFTSTTPDLKLAGNALGNDWKEIGMSYQELNAPAIIDEMNAAIGTWNTANPDLKCAFKYEAAVGDNLPKLVAVP